MSPSEFDLRAALRDGEGEGLNVDRIVARGHATRGRRRAQLLSTAGVVVFVAALGTGGAFLLGSSSESGGSGGQEQAGQDAVAGGTAAASSAPAATASPHGSKTSNHLPLPASRADAAADVACPTSFPRTLLPGGGSPGQFGAGGRMFARRPVSIVVCAYGTGASVGNPARLDVTGTDATALAASIENAASTPDTTSCSDESGGGVRQLAMIGVSADGSTLRTVTTTITARGCTDKITNGTAVRYSWRPPSGLRDILTSLTPTRVTLPTNAPSGRNIGTPIHN